MQDTKVVEIKAKVEATGNELRIAVREAMMKADPGLDELLKQSVDNKFKAGREDGKPGADRPGLDHPGEGDRQKLKGTLEAGKADPAGRVAEEKKKAATFLQIKGN